MLSYEDVVEMGRAEVTPDAPPFTAPSVTDVATLVYTSGTSGISPREGVCLTHGNLMHQLGTLGAVIGDSQPGDTAVSMLPPWHIYERTTTYFRCVCAMQTVYRCVFIGIPFQGVPSERGRDAKHSTFQRTVVSPIDPTLDSYHSFLSLGRARSSPRHLRVDLLRHEPQFFCTVPLVLDAIAGQASKRLALTAGLTGWFARLLFGIGQYFVLQRRTSQGVNVDYARKPPPLHVRLWAALMTWLLRPLYLLADKLVYSRIRAGAGVHKVKCVVTGGGSFGRPLDDWFECVVRTLWAKRIAPLHHQSKGGGG